ncbi:hypothetical protein ACFPMF_02830 [Larkinella bovis]|uniref:Uncharacterized protein n=1 Tax=Larkinella bovis TaxID=683041 RepID=A0ABW0I6Q9_9BACT
MKTYWIILSLFALFSCSGNTGGVEGERRVEGLGRQVSGTRLMSEQYLYASPCAYIPEGSLASMVGLQEGTALTWNESDHACEVFLDNKKIVSLSLTNRRPFESVFHADYYFNRLYQPEALESRGKRLPYTGPEPEGVGAEGPTEGVGDGSPASNDAVAGAPTDSLQAHAEPGGVIAQLKDNEERKTTSPSIRGVGEKAVWDARTRTLHVLNLQHVFHIMVNQSSSAETDSMRATKLASLLIRQVDEEADQGERTIY